MFGIGWTWPRRFKPLARRCPHLLGPLPHRLRHLRLLLALHGLPGAKFHSQLFPWNSIVKQDRFILVYKWFPICKTVLLNDAIIIKSICLILNSGRQYDKESFTHFYRCLLCRPAEWSISWHVDGRGFPCVSHLCLRHQKQGFLTSLFNFKNISICFWLSYPALGLWTFVKYKSIFSIQSIQKLWSLLKGGRCSEMAMCKWDLKVVVARDSWSHLRVGR